jgi:hypothetical protein
MRARATGSPVTSSGEAWTDARGYATVALPRAAGVCTRISKTNLRPLAPGVTASIAAEFSDGRFTVETDEPHARSPGASAADHAHREEAITLAGLCCHCRQRCADTKRTHQKRHARRLATHLHLLQQSDLQEKLCRG